MSSTASPPPPSTSGAGGRPKGRTAEGASFIVPRTLNTFEGLAYPRNWNIARGFSMIVAFTCLGLVLFAGLPVWFHVSVAMFFRCGYDVFLGLVLDFQSKKQSFTKLYKRWKASKSKMATWLLAQLEKNNLPDMNNADFAKKDYPDEFRAWLVYRNLVDFILLNDSVNYVLLGLKCFNMPEEVDLLLVAQYAIGLFLVAFNYWAKVDAHRCIGDYCWYWGDFFFMKDENLTFDGIFELFPHPMYTVGYSMYYGYSLICRSYTMLFVSLTHHLMQLAFLALVEEPHIERTYGGSSESKLDSKQYHLLYDKKEGLFPGKKTSVFVIDLDVFRSSDIMLVGFILYGCLSCYLLPPEGVVAQVVAWRVFHWLGLGTVLWKQSTRSWWTRHYTDRGRSLYEAFENWRRVYNLSITMNLVVFVGLALRYMEPLGDSGLTLSRLAWAAIGVLLILLNVWSSSSTFHAVGDFGWFYGDFFIPQKAFQPNLVYTGIYRFLNNPDCVIGYAGLYGLALISESWLVFWVALGSQLCNIAFVNAVEIPHMRKIYKTQVRQEPPIERKLSSKLQRFIPNEETDKLIGEASKIKRTAMREIYGIYKTIKSKRDSLRGKDSGCGAGAEDGLDVELHAPEEVQLGEDIIVQVSVSGDHNDTDWLGIYPYDVESAPGQSRGRWHYSIPKSQAKGEIVFSYGHLPTTSGVYEIRYHANNSYDVVSSIPIQIVE